MPNQGKSRPRTLAVRKAEVARLVEAAGGPSCGHCNGRGTDHSDWCRTLYVKKVVQVELPVTRRPGEAPCFCCGSALHSTAVDGSRCDCVRCIPQ